MNLYSYLLLLEQSSNMNKFKTLQIIETFLVSKKWFIINIIFFI